MFTYIIRRVLMMIPVLIGATILAFLLVEASGDPIQEQVTALEMSTGEPVPESTVQAMEERIYADRSAPERYWLWLTGIGDTKGDIGILQGEWGPSVEGTATDVGDDLTSKFWTTFRLVTIATVASVGLAILTGVVSAVRQYNWVDYLLTFVGFLALALPTFWFGALVKEAGIQANQAMGKDYFKTYGDSTTGFTGSGWATVVDALPYLILPTLVLMLTGYASMGRYQRAAMLEVLNSDYVRLAKAKGVRSRTVMRRHALRTALIPVATFAPLGIATAMGGSLIMEKVFGWQGLGAYAFDAIKSYDIFAIMGYLLLSGVLVMAGILVSDLLYGVLDPRIRYE
ncbi:ABC transporter permease [Haloglycomyces albus]|uniref:ABC transporter permease n=1 Tax=Haloglycomyces albus TaxID=526067 RepID=UPI00046D9575|nr:ABC transporter permease [Haloglycomyces albus]